MKVKSYSVLRQHSNEIQTIEFDEFHAKEIGTALGPDGINFVEALKLINKWNRMAKKAKFWIAY